MNQSNPKRVAIVGAGLSGLVAARLLVEHGHSVRVFDKARGVGGRIATRRLESWGERGRHISIDHGAQYFTARDPEFVAVVRDWVESGIVAEWNGRIGVAHRGALTDSDSGVVRWVGIPSMTAIPKRLAEGLDIALETRIDHVLHGSDGWSLIDDHDRRHTGFDVLLLSAPPQQSTALLRNVDGASEIREQIGKARLDPCWALALVFDEPLSIGYDGLFIHDSPLSWVARNNSKPGRSERETWVIHAATPWSTGNVDIPAETAIAELTREFWLALGLPPQPVASAMAHRWLFASPSATLATRFVFEPDLGLGVCGDWCGGPRVEGAYLSGLALGRAVLEG